MSIKSRIQNYFAKREIEYEGSKYRDKVIGIHTGAFHYIKKLIYPLLSPHIKKINISIDRYYDKTTSVNSKIFKKIISEMEELDKDQDEEMTSGRSFGMTRKAFYIFVMKFFVVLYEFDTHYMERGDYVIKRLLEEQKNIYLDAQACPENWFPNRKPLIIQKYLILRNREKKI